MVLVLGLAGLRFGECTALRVADVDLLRRRLKVKASVSEINGHMFWSTPKTHQTRDVPIPRFLADLLAVEMIGKSPRDLLFCSPEGEPLRLSNWRRRVWDPAVASVGLEVRRNSETCAADARPSVRRHDARCVRRAVRQRPGPADRPLHLRSAFPIDRAWTLNKPRIA